MSEHSENTNKEDQHMKPNIENPGENQSSDESIKKEIIKVEVAKKEEESNVIKDESHNDSNIISKEESSNELIEEEIESEKKENDTSSSTSLTETNKVKEENRNKLDNSNNENVQSEEIESFSIDVNITKKNVPEITSVPDNNVSVSNETKSSPVKEELKSDYNNSNDSIKDISNKEIQTNTSQNENEISQNENEISQNENEISQNENETSQNDNETSQNENETKFPKEESPSSTVEQIKTIEINEEKVDVIEDHTLGPVDSHTESSHDQAHDQSFGTENSEPQMGLHRREGASSTDDLDHESFSEGDSRDSDNEEHDIDDEEEEDIERSHTEEEEGNETNGQTEEVAPSKKRLDDDEDRRNPQYIPKKGTFYEHDDRTAEDCDETGGAGDGDRKDVPGASLGLNDSIDGAGDASSGRRGKVWKEKESRWDHDRYDETEQSPKSSHELVQAYGYDIRNEDGPPRARRRRRYGRGPNKYTRNWEDEEAYGKAGSDRNLERSDRGRNRRGGGGRNRNNNGQPNTNTNPPSGEDFPPLAGSTSNAGESGNKSSGEEPVLSATYSNRVSQEKRQSGPLTKKDFPALSTDKSDNEKSSNSQVAPRPTGRVTRGRGGGSRGRGGGHENGRIPPESSKNHDFKEVDFESCIKTRGRNFPPRGTRNNTASRQQQQQTGTETQVFTPSTRVRNSRGRGRGAFGNSDGRGGSNAIPSVEFRNSSGDFEGEEYTDNPNKSTNQVTNNQTQQQIQNQNQQRTGTDFRKPSRKSENGPYTSHQQSDLQQQHRRQSAPMPPRLQQETGGGGNNIGSNSNNNVGTSSGGGSRPKRYSSIRQRPLPDPQSQAQPSQQSQQQQQQQQPPQQSGYSQPPQQPQQQAYYPPTLPPPAGGAFMAYGSPAGDSAPVLAAAPPPPPHQGPPQYAPFIPQAATQRIPPHQFIGGQPMINYVQTQGQFPPATFPTFQNYTPVGPSQPPPELFQPQGGITYYSPEEQVMQQRSITKKRPRTAIPIVPPPERGGMVRASSSSQGEQMRPGSPSKYANQQEVA